MQIELSGAEAGLAIHGIPISLNFTTSGRVRGAFTLEALHKALERLRYIHPLMAVRLDPGTNGVRPCYTTENVPPIPVRMIERIADEAWAREVEQEIVIASNYRTGPLMRVVWLRGEEVSDLVLVTDHITADGLGGIYALRDLLRLLAEPEVKIEPCLPEKYADLVPTEMRKMINAKNDAGPGEMPQMIETPAEQAPLLPLRVLPIEFTEMETSILVARCKVEKTTVQGALCTAFAIPFAERQPDQPLRGVESPYNLRNRMVRPLEDIYGVYISLAYSQVDCRPGRDRWEMAREVSRGLAGATDEQLFSIPIVMIHAADRPLTVPIVNFDYDLSISNLGRVNIPEQYGNLRLESIYAPTMNISMPFHRILGVTTFAGKMRCTFTSRDPNAADLVRRSREILAEMTA